MTNTSLKTASLTLLATGLVLAGMGCGSSSNSTDSTTTTTGSTPTASNSPTPAAGGNLSGTVTIDGSSTVYPIVNAMGEDFSKANSQVKTVVNKSGTGSGMQKFERGEIDIATASRPITGSEIEALKKANIDFLEIPVANDGVCVVVNPKNSSITSLTPADLKKAWNDASTVKTWADWHAGWPAAKINFYGPTSNHGTYEYFTETIDGKKGNIRKDAQMNQDYNVIVQEVAGDANGIGYMGLNYYIQNKDKVKIVPIDGGKGPITPSEATVTDGTYAPLSRPLFIYVSKKAYARPEVQAFLKFALSDDGKNDVKEANYVVLPKDALDLIQKRVTDQTTGSVFTSVGPGVSVSQALSKK
jgi:phosphate transport system substrate-binding protein